MLPVPTGLSWPVSILPGLPGPSEPPLTTPGWPISLPAAHPGLEEEVPSPGDMGVVGVEAATFSLADDLLVLLGAGGAQG